MLVLRRLESGRSLAHLNKGQNLKYLELVDYCRFLYILFGGLLCVWHVLPMKMYLVMYGMSCQ